MVEYESYQSTSYRWLPKVPSHWHKKSIRQITSVLSERCGNRDYRLLSVYREYGVIPKDSRDDNHNKESLDLSNYKVVHIGDLVLNKMKMWQGSLGVSQYEGIVSPAYIICKVLDKDINLDYLHLLLRSARFKSYYNQYSYGIRVGQWDMHYEDFKNLKVYMPPRAEQDQIVRFLDWKVSEINKLIGIRRKEIQELEGLKKVIVHKAITGKNCDTEIRDTSIEWIGAIPAIIYAALGGIRLARFNLNTGVVHGYFQGMPIPNGGCLIATFVISGAVLPAWLVGRQRQRHVRPVPERVEVDLCRSRARRGLHWC